MTIEEASKFIEAEYKMAADEMRAEAAAALPSGASVVMPPMDGDL